MEKVIFKLKEPQKGISKNKQKPTLVNMFFSFGYYERSNSGTKKYIPLKYSTGLKITPFYWKDKPDYQAKQISDFAYKNFNIKLANLKNLVIDLHRELENKGKIITPDILRDELNRKLGRGTNIHNLNFGDFIRLLIKESEEGSRIGKNGKKISKATIVSYKTTLKHLEKYQEADRRNINYDQVDLKFYKKFTSYLQSQNFMPNTIGKNIKNIKVFLKEANKRGLTDNQNYRDDEFRVYQEETEQIYLNDSELMGLYNLDLKDSSRLEKVRDLFIIGCFTGLRFSDLGQMKAEHFIADNTRLRINTLKTGEIVEIPLHWTVKELHKKYDGRLPETISNQKMNKYIKEICQLAGFNEKISIAKTKGGLRVDRSFPKHELVTVHTARRSFATNMYLAGVPTISIMKITGHRTEKAFLRYIKISQEDNARKLAEHPYFKNNKLKIV